MRKKTILTLTLAAIFGLSSLIPLAMAEDKPKTAPSKTQSSVKQPATQSANSITQAAIKAGVRTCANRINQVSNFLTAGVKDVGTMMFYSQSNPDKQMSSVSMEIPLKDAASGYATASFAPDQANSCTGMYETVVYWPQTCTEVGENNYGKFKNVGKLSKNIYVRDDGVSTKVFLLPAGKGCVSIKKEIIR
jgi:hypothetical protein